MRPHWVLSANTEDRLLSVPNVTFGATPCGKRTVLHPGVDCGAGRRDGKYGDGTRPLSLARRRRFLLRGTIGRRQRGLLNEASSLTCLSFLAGKLFAPPVLSFRPSNNYPLAPLRALTQVTNLGMPAKCLCVDSGSPRSARIPVLERGTSRAGVRRENKALSGEHAGFV